MLPGNDRGKDMSLSTMFEAVGAKKAGLIDQDELTYIEQNACPGCGSCSGMFTANSMNCLCEVLGIALPGNGTIPAVYSGRMQLAKKAGMAVMDMVEKGIRPRDIVNEQALRNGLACDMALGCSSNTVLHLLAIAKEAQVELDLNVINEISQSTPNLCKLAPAGPDHIVDLYRAGGVQAVMKELQKKGLIDDTLMTVTGKTIREKPGNRQRTSIITSSKISRARIRRPAASPSSLETSHRRAASSNAAPWIPPCSSIPARRVSLTARKKPSRRSTTVRSSKGMWWSSATRT